MISRKKASVRVSTAGIARRGGKFLVALRKPGSSIGESWEFPGGKRREDETAQQALKREFREELETEILVEEKIFSGTFHNRSTEYLLEAYAVKVITETFVLHEHQKVRWVSLDELKHLSMAESDRDIVRHLLRAEGL